MGDPESLRQIAHTRAPFSTWLGIVLLFALFGVIVLAVIGPSRRGSNYEETRAKKRIENLKKLREQNEKTLNSYGWVDKNKGIARIPINRAMELTIAELAQKKPTPAGPIATPAAAQVSPAAPASPAPASPSPAASPELSAAQPTVSPSAPAPASPSPPAQPSPAASASPAPAKTP